jgi:hypothetical protein
MPSRGAGRGQAHFQALLHAVNTMQLERYVKRDFSDVFEKSIKA